AAENTKLQRDVTVINSAIRTYLVNGGVFLQADLQNPATVLTKLKNTANANSRKEIAGLRGSMMDERLSVEMQKASEAGEGTWRARFIADPGNPGFVVQRSGPPGIRRFVLDERLAGQPAGEEERKANLKLAKNDPWVWDYKSTDEPSIHARPDPAPSR